MKTDRLLLRQGQSPSPEPNSMGRLDRALPLLAALLCVVQPILDVIAYWNQQFGLPNTWTTVLRLGLLLAGFVTGFLVSRHRSAYLIFGLAILACLGGHIAACLQAEQGYLNWTEDLIDQGRTLVLPVTALTFMSYLQANRRVLPAMLRAMAINLALILLVMVLSTLTRTDPHTYPSKALGVRGWFIWPSPQSAILSILAPLFVAWALQRWPDRTLPVTLASLVSFGMLFFYGTRLSYLTLAGVGLYMAVCVFFFGGELRRRQAVGILACALLFAALYPVSPMARNRAAVGENEQRKQDRVTAAAAEAFAQSGTQAKPDLDGVTAAAEDASAQSAAHGESGPNGENAEAASQSAAHGESGPNGENMEAIRAAYRYNLQGMIDRFGLDRVARSYHYTLDAGQICNDRVMKARFCSLLREDLVGQAPLSRLFGIELERTRVQDTEIYDFYADDWYVGTENYDPENDVWGVLTLNGILGLALLAAFLLYVGLRSLIALWKQPGRFTPLFAAFLAAYGLGLIYAVSTASTLRRNNASVYFAWAAAGLWYLAVRPLPSGGTKDGH